MADVPEIQIDVLAPGMRPRADHVGLRVGQDIQFSSSALESYAFAKFEPLVHDALVVAATVEYADKIVKRPAYGWCRKLSVCIPVHDAPSWRHDRVSDSLHEALSFLTGDAWTIEFIERSQPAVAHAQEPLALDAQASGVIAYSDGIDSRAVAGIVGAELGDGLVRVRLGARSRAGNRSNKKAIPFTGIPYAVHTHGAQKESSGRSRGFKFAIISGIAAYLVDSPSIYVPESGQGSLGPALVTSAHSYPDYRNHPLFTVRMQRFLHALFGNQVKFVFPRLWNTKAETLKAYVDAVAGAQWDDTRSCWRSSQWSSVAGKLRHCGVCAACMLRRMSMHAAHLCEKPCTYVATDLSASTIESAVDPEYKHLNAAFRDYALAGVLHLDHLADMSAPEGAATVQRHAHLIAPALGLELDDSESRLKALVQHHTTEWMGFLDFLGDESFVNHWTRRKR